MLNNENQAAVTVDVNEAIASGAPPALETLATADTMAFQSPANQDTPCDNRVWPEEWRDGAENNAENFFAHVRRQEAYWDSLGVSCHRAAPDGSNRLLPRRFGSLQNQHANIDVNTEYVALTREAPAGQPENHAKCSRFYRMVGNSRQAVDMIVVPREEINALEAQVDVVSYDNPAAGTGLYLEHANNFVTATMTKNNWRPGQLIGQDGADPATLSQSPSFAASDRWNEISERRSATSTGHLLQYQRPYGVSLGWGGYDRYTHWQSYGRRVTKDMVKEGNWSTDPLSPFTIVNESDEFVETVTQLFKLEDLPPQPRNLVSLTSTWANVYKDN
ncbi:hypothetical protein TASIC1_0008040900 [Trichoderma asperellum]|uniref:Uncharacterized protein n=1 Tax=Trichoderma asperellum TaxID=101201 RepID=A0A6V8R3I7_TRIAP|nr:hypothetical protein TASIC1_0008040900 [Trichoderma asperellum]